MEINVTTEAKWPWDHTLNTDERLRKKTASGGPSFRERDLRPSEALYSGKGGNRVKGEKGDR